MNTRNLALMMFLALTISACGGAVATQPPAQATQAPAEESGPAVLLQDDFSDPNSGWDRVNETQGSSDYQDGGYRIFVNETNYSVWANPNRTSYTDVHVEVDAQKIGGDDDNEFGIICRHADPGNYYAAVITSDGFFGFWRRVDGGDLEMIGGDQMQTSDTINLGGESNHIHLDCLGSTLTLFANGEQLGQVTDSTISSGDVGLYAGTFDVAGTDVLFDNFFVYEHH